MSLCGCFPSCSCQLSVCDNGLLTITGDGDPATGGWELCVNETPLSIVPGGGISVLPGGPYGHNPTVSARVVQTDTIAMSVNPDGEIEAHLLVAPGTSGGVPVGTPLMWLTNVAPDGYLMATGPNMVGYVEHDDYPALFAVVGHSMSGGVDPGDGTFYVGLPDDSFFKTSGPANSVMAGTGGAISATIGVENLPPHIHGVDDPGHDHDGSTDIVGDHVHAPGDGANGFVAYGKPSAGATEIQIAVGTSGYFVEVGADGKQKDNAFTGGGGSHAHAVDTNPALTGISVLSEGDGTPLPLPLPPYWTGNIIIKT